MAAKADPDAISHYYRCPYSASNPRHAAAHPDHPHASISVREEVLLGVIGDFLDDYLFGHDRATRLAARIPASAADQAARRDDQARALRTELARVDTAQAGLITELEQLGADTTPATTAYRQRIRARNAQLHDQRTHAATLLAALQAAALADNDPSLLDELPYLPRILAEAPEPLKEKLLAALDVQCLYRKDKSQVSIWVTITDTTPATLAALLNDPRADLQPRPRTPAHPAASGELQQSPMSGRSTTITENEGDQGRGRPRWRGSWRGSWRGRREMLSSRRARSCSKSRARAAGAWIRPIRRPSSATSARTRGSASTRTPNASAAGVMSYRCSIARPRAAASRSPSANCRWPAGAAAGRSPGSRPRVSR